jgi:hypothetical protein
MANELRVRTNFVGGLIDNNPLLVADVSLSSAALAAVPVIGSTQHFPIIIDPDGIGGAPEVVYVTAHTSAATTGTILRGQEGTTAREHARDIPWIHGSLVSDFTGLEPWMENIPNWASPSASAGTWIFADFLSEAPAYPVALSLSSTSAAQNDYYEWPIVLSSGVWNLLLHHRKSTNVGIYTVSLDGVSIGTIDGYAAAVAAGQDTITGFTPTSGLHLLRFTMATKNAASSAYAANILAVSLRRTA